MISKIILVFLLGAVILAAAILLNLLAGKLSLSTWYDFVKDTGKTSFLSYVWLFLIYPFGLGLSAYLAIKFLNVEI